MTLRVYIIDEHSQVRKNLVRRLAETDGIAVVGQSGDVPQALEDIQVLDPDVVLLEVKMRRANGIEVCFKMAQAGSRAKVVVLTSYIDAGELRRARDAGAAAYLLKGLDMDRLAENLREVVNREAADEEVDLARHAR